MDGLSSDSIFGNFSGNIRDYSLSQLADLAEEIRSFLLSNISVTGGHIGANLATVELTIALHKVFDSPSEPILFDTGHQGYTHKVLTGRASSFSTLNTFRGMSRFLSPTESEHDLVESSHAGTAISTGLGMSLARRLRGDYRPVVAVVGDSALAEGSSLEGINHAAVEGANLKIVINDNGFAISPGFGGIHEILQSESRRAESFFNAFGMEYLGPVNGHNISELVDALSRARQLEGTPVVHAKTEKGHRWPPADSHPNRMHFSMPFDAETGELRDTTTPRTYATVFGEVLDEAMKSRADLVAICPSTIYATGLEKVFENFPERSIDPGMMEQHAVALAAGLALEDVFPVLAYQATFLQRAYDQLFHDLCFSARPSLTVVFRNGFSGYDSPTHHGIYDFAYLRSLPNLRILAPKDEREFIAMTEQALLYASGPTMILVPYGPVSNFGGPKSSDFSLPVLERDGKGTLVVTVGKTYEVGAHVAKEIDGAHLNLRQVKPLPREDLCDLAQRFERVISIEEGVLEGGIGAEILSVLAEQSPKESLRIGLPSAYIEPGAQSELAELYGLDEHGVLSQINEKWPDLQQQDD